MCANILKETPVLSKGSWFLPVTYNVSFNFFSLCSMSLFWYLLQTLKKTCKISHTIVSGKLLAPWFSMKIFILELYSNLDWEFLDWLHSCSRTFLCCYSGFFSSLLLYVGALTSWIPSLPHLNWSIFFNNFLRKVALKINI